MSDGKVAAALDEIRELVADQDKLIDRMKTENVDVHEFNATQDKMAARVPRLLAAMDAVLDLVREWEQNPSVTYRHVTQSLQASIAYGLLGEDGS